MHICVCSLGMNSKRSSRSRAENAGGSAYWARVRGRLLLIAGPGVLVVVVIAAAILLSGGCGGPSPRRPRAAPAGLRAATDAQDASEGRRARRRRDGCHRRAADRE